MKNKVKIIIDSSSDIGIQLAKERDIDIIAYQISVNDTHFKDGDIETKQLFELVEKENELPKTAAITIQEIKDSFTPYIEKGYDILYIGIGSKFSRSNANIEMAVSELPDNRVFLVDSATLSSGEAILALKAADLRDKGLSAEEIKNNLDKIKNKVYTQFVLKTLEYMKKGGRTTNFQAAIGQALKIRPVISVRDGEMFVYKKAMGKQKKGMDIIIDDFLREVKNNNVVMDYIYITHTINDKLANYCLEILEKNNIKPKMIINQIAGSVIASHCGEGCIGLLYEVKEHTQPKND